jgi:hypothetical protein
MTFVIKNKHSYAVRLACLTLKPREQMITHKLSQAVSDAADRGDVVIIFTEDV